MTIIGLYVYINSVQRCFYLLYTQGQLLISPVSYLGLPLPRGSFLAGLGVFWPSGDRGLAYVEE